MGAKPKNKSNNSKTKQPYQYVYRSDYPEPDWRRLPGYKNVTEAEWNDALWQRRHMVQNLKQLKEALGSHLTDTLIKDMEADQKQFATMSMLVPPQMINTMDEKDLKNDPIRRYMIPMRSDRHPKWPTHPKASRDSLHEAEMWVVEGLTHRYPTKVLAELLSTCPQYCGHCTRMDLVGQNTESFQKRRFEKAQPERLGGILDYLRKNRSVRDVVVSGGDMANVPAAVLEKFVDGLLDIENIRDIRLATKGLMGLPQHFLQDDVLKALDRLAKRAFKQGVSLAVHTHVNHANSVTRLVAQVSRKLLSLGIRDIRNQGVILAGTNDSAKTLLDLCFRLLDQAGIMPYYFYMCDMIPNSEHWRISLKQAQEIQHDMMGYLPGFATPRLLCDCPYVGKRWVHQNHSYDEVRGISYWTKNYLTSIELSHPEMLDHLYEYYDPIHTLPPEGQKYWKDQMKPKAVKKS